jgi:hypothetical protein
MWPAALRSASKARASDASTPRTTTRAASVLMETLAAVLALRTWPSTAAATASTAGSPAPPPMVPSAPRSADGHGARWTEPSCHQDHTSSVTNGMNGANSRSSTPRAERSAPRADSAPGPLPYARAFTSSR